MWTVNRRYLNDDNFTDPIVRSENMAQKTELTVNVGGYEDFVLKGTVILEKGWMKYDDPNRKDKLMPKLKKGDEVNIDFKLCEKETSPPKHYTIETLNNYLKNPFREEKAAAADSENEDDSEDYRAIFEGLDPHSGHLPTISP